MPMISRHLNPIKESVGLNNTELVPTCQWQAVVKLLLQGVG